MNIYGQVGWRAAAAVNPVSTPLLLDTYSGAAAAYSLRKLRTTYTGNAITVRRSSDNTSTDIGFDGNGNLDTTSLLSFVGANNISLYSEELDNAYWTKKSTTVTTNQTTAPDGTTTADLVSETTANDTHGISPNYVSTSFPAGTSWNISCYVKKGPGVNAPNTFGVGFQHGLGLDTTILFSFATGGSIDSNINANDSNVGSSMTSVGGGWYRCSVWGTVAISHSKVACGSFRFNNNSNTISSNAYIGKTDANIYIWGWQFSKGLNDTSVLTTQPYTKTTTTAAGNGFVSIWYDQTASGNNLTQATLTRQPAIVSAGSLITQSGKPALLFNSSLLQATRVFSTSNFSIFNTLSGNSGQSNAAWLNQHGGGVNVNRTVFIQPSDISSPYNKLKTFLNNGTAYNIISTNVVFDGTLKLINVTSDGSGNTNQWVNSTAEGSLTGVTWSPLNTNLNVGALGNATSYYTGYTNELVCYTTNQNTNRSGIESNIKNFYGL
jgi:hypothetical protein